MVAVAEKTFEFFIRPSTYIPNDKLIFIHTCFKGGFESSVSSSSVTITPEMYPDHVTRALNRTRLVGTTYWFGENWTIPSIKTYDRKGR